MKVKFTAFLVPTKKKKRVITITRKTDLTEQVVENNKLLTQRAEVDVVPNNVLLDIAGTGCALMQVTFVMIKLLIFRIT